MIIIIRYFPLLIGSICGGIIGFKAADNLLLALLIIPLVLLIIFLVLVSTELESRWVFYKAKNKQKGGE